MKIVVQGSLIETREILDIYEIDTQLNREAGFVIKLIDCSGLTFVETIPSGPFTVEYKKKWRSRMEEVIKLWEQDKHDYPTIDW